MRTGEKARNEVMAALAARLEDVQSRIAQATSRAGRPSGTVTLISVTKTLPVPRITEAYQLGLRVFGENRVQEARDKIPEVDEWLKRQQSEGYAEPIRWHMIGHLQRNKVRYAVGLFEMIHSVDSVRLAEEVSRRCRAQGIRMPILLEVNISAEAGKYGFAPKGMERAVESVLSLPNLELRGLMTMAPIVADPEQARPYFARLRMLRDRLGVRFPEAQWEHLSMGMTDDFEIAIEEGATLVRIGRAIFGERGE